MMLEAAIIGAGPLGGALAHVLARRDSVAAVRLIDDRDEGRVASGMALDLMQSAPVHRFATRVVAGRHVSEAAGGEIVLLADAPTGDEWGSDKGLSILKQLTYGNRYPMVICTGASQRELVERGVRELGIPRKRIIGSAPHALAGALRALVALEANGSPADVALTVFGIPPQQVMVPWEDATIGGIGATRVLTEPALRRLVARLPALWPPGPYALAQAAMIAVDAVVGRSRRRMSAFVAPDDSLGRRARTVALSVTLGPGGVTSAEVPSLTPHDRVALENAMFL